MKALRSIILKAPGVGRVEKEGGEEIEALKRSLRESNSIIIIN
jgi:hypothetical protein